MRLIRGIRRWLLWQLARRDLERALTNWYRHDGSKWQVEDAVARHRLRQRLEFWEVVNAADRSVRAVNRVVGGAGESDTGSSSSTG